MMPLLFGDDPDTTVVEPDDLPRHTIIGLPAPARLPASPPQPPGAGYLLKYPVQLDPPLEVTIHWGDGVDCRIPRSGGCRGEGSGRLAAR